MRGSPPKPGEQPSFDVVYRQGARYVWRTLRRLGVAERHCEDAMQDVFVIVQRRLPEYDPRDRLTGWLGAITANVAAKYRSKEQREPLVSDDNASAEPPNGDPDHEQQRAAARDLVLRLLEAVEPERRIVYIQHELDGLTIPEIARALGIPEGTASSRLRHARQEIDAAYKRITARDRHGAIIPLSQLLDAERPIPPLPPGVEERVWSRLESGNGAGNSGARAPAPTAPALSLGSVVAGVLLLGMGIAIGAVWDPLHRGSSPSPSPVAAVPVAVATATADAAPVVPAPSSTAAAPSASAATTAQDDAAAERALMGKAADALAAGDTAAALAAVEEHARRFRGGRLVEDREATWIAALLRAGRSAEAREHVERFARAYPNSARLPEMRRVIAAREAPR